jgi:uncharacterized membrane protein YeaQ/YmgE (transglycosylase-associated protein family)
MRVLWRRAREAATNFARTLTEREMEYLWFALIGLAAGWLAGQFFKGSGFGLVGNLIVGVLGALLGGFLFSLAGVLAGGLIGALITATVGAVLLLYLMTFVAKQR